MKNNKAFTLAELILAAAITAFAFSAILLGILTYSLIGKKARQITIATGHAEYVLEEIKDSTISAIQSTDWAQWARDEGLDDLDRGDDLEAITVSTSGTNPLLVQVTVSWDEDGASRSIDFYTKVAE
ncbi:MAG: type II secretion system protein [Candidatus Omnitrophica bacterium]|nr:type II secretion system protein [Candidatus Omnitrophota bacterium]